MHSVEPSLTGLNTSCYSKELLRAKRMHFPPILLTYYVYRYLAISNYQQLTRQPSNLGLPKVGKNVPTRQHTLIIMIIGDMPHKWISSQWNFWSAISHGEGREGGQGLVVGGRGGSLCKVVQTPEGHPEWHWGVYLPSIVKSTPCPRLREGQVLSTVAESWVGRKYVHQSCNVFVTTRRTTRDQQASSVSWVKSIQRERKCREIPMVKCLLCNVRTVFVRSTFCVPAWRRGDQWHWPGPECVRGCSWPHVCVLHPCTLKAGPAFFPLKLPYVLTFVLENVHRYHLVSTIYYI